MVSCGWANTHNLDYSLFGVGQVMGRVAVVTWLVARDGAVFTSPPVVLVGADNVLHAVLWIKVVLVRVMVGIPDLGEE